MRDTDSLDLWRRVEKNFAKKNKTLVTDRAADVGRMLPTVEPTRAQPRSAAAPEAFTPLKSQAFTPSQQTPQQPLQTEEILGNTVDPCWRFSAQTVPTRSSLTMPDGLPFGFVIQPFAAPEDSTRSGSPAAAAVRARRRRARVPGCVRALTSNGAGEGGCGGRRSGARAAAPSAIYMSRSRPPLAAGCATFAGTCRCQMTSRARRQSRRAGRCATLWYACVQRPSIFCLRPVCMRRCAAGLGWSRACLAWEMPRAGASRPGVRGREAVADPCEPCFR